MSIPPPYAEPVNGRYDYSALPPYDEGDTKWDFEIPEKPVPAPEYDDAFPINEPVYNDKVFTYIFTIVVIAFTGLAHYSYKSLSNNHTFWDTSTNSNDMGAQLTKSARYLYMFVSVTTITPLVCSTFLLLLVYLCPTAFIIISFLLVPLSLFTFAFSSFWAGAILPALLFGVLGTLMMAFMFNNFNRFSFSALMLKLVVSAMTKYPSTILVSFMSSIITAFISIVYMVSLVMIVNWRTLGDDTNCPHTNGNDVCVSTVSIFVYLFAMFSGFYIFQVLQNTTHVILAGVFSSWYFFDTYPEQSKPKTPAFGAIRRAFTYCFGSICFGSLLVSLVQTLRMSLQLVKSRLQSIRQQDNESNGDASLLTCFLLCFVTILEWIAREFEYWMQWFNRYAYSYLSMYGKPYLASARDTFEILKYKGMDILINDSLIGSAISFYSLLSMGITGLVLYITFQGSNLQEMGPEMLTIGLFGGLLVAYFIVSTTINCLDVGFVTFTIGLAVDPEAFTRTDAGNATATSIERLQAWEKMNVYYPGIRERVVVDWPEEAIP